MVERDVSRYIQLIERFHNIKVPEDRDFQKSFQAYWGMNPARLSPHFIHPYFPLLENLKANVGVSVEEVARRLHQIPTKHNRITQTLQFSFSTKLVHMIRTHEPVYDRNVQRFFFLPNGSTQKRLIKNSWCCCLRISFYVTSTSE